MHIQTKWLILLLFYILGIVCSMKKNSITKVHPTSSFLYNQVYSSLEGTFEDWYQSTTKIKCPFFRRRAGDIVDGFGICLQFVVARHKSLPIPLLPGCLPYKTLCGGNKSCNHIEKTRGLDMEAIAAQIFEDWQPLTGRGYMINGRLTHSIYRDDTFFDGPDPDMPVRGLRKYLHSASQLFDSRVSRADILDAKMNKHTRMITVWWRFEGVLNLPWHPTLKPWTGHTVYVVDNEGLIERHIEYWDISVFDAFLSAIFPKLSHMFGGSPPALSVNTIRLKNNRVLDDDDIRLSGWLNECNIDDFYTLEMN